WRKDLRSHDECRRRLRATACEVWLDRFHARHLPRGLEDDHQLTPARPRTLVLPVFDDSPERVLGLLAIQFRRQQVQASHAAPTGLTQGVVELATVEQRLLEAGPERMSVAA